jgi:hypothetical protein
MTDISDVIPPVSPDPDTMPDEPTTVNLLALAAMIVALIALSIGSAAWFNENKHNKANKARAFAVKCDHAAKDDDFDYVIDKCMRRVKSRSAVLAKLQDVSVDAEIYDNHRARAEHELYQLQRTFCKRKRASMQELVMLCDYNPMTRTYGYERGR